MNHRFKYLLTAAFIALLSSAARAEMTTFNLTDVTSQTVRGLGTSFVIGCGLLALGLVLAAFISKKK